MLTFSADPQIAEKQMRAIIFYLTTFARNFDVPVANIPADAPVARALDETRGRVVFTFVGTFNRTMLIAKRGHSVEDKVNY